jgi:hypothetical protein
MTSITSVEVVDLFAASARGRRWHYRPNAERVLSLLITLSISADTLVTQSQSRAPALINTKLELTDLARLVRHACEQSSGL